MDLLGNFIWFIFGGLVMVIGWYLARPAHVFPSIIDIPFRLQHLKLAVATLAPIGKTAVDRGVRGGKRFPASWRGGGDS